MKKTILSIFALLLIFVSCQQDPIFYDIAQEIKLDDPTIGGKVLSIKELDGTLYATNGLLNYKSLSDHRWSKMSTPLSTVTNVAIGGNYVYISGNPTDDDTFTIYGRSKDSTNWTKIKTGVTSLFDDNAGTAYYTKDEKLYKLNETTSEDITDSYNKVDGMNSAVKVGDTDYFFNTTISASNGSFFYIADEKALKIGNTVDTSTWKTTSELSSTITSICIYNNQLYVGTESGVQVATINNDGNLSSFSNLPNNAESAFGDREILGVWKFDDNDNFFVSVTSGSSSIYDALWGYNSDSGKWNLE